MAVVVKIKIMIPPKFPFWTRGNVASILYCSTYDLVGVILTCLSCCINHNLSRRSLIAIICWLSFILFGGLIPYWHRIFLAWTILFSCCASAQPFQIDISVIIIFLFESRIFCRSDSMFSLLIDHHDGMMSVIVGFCEPWIYANKFFSELGHGFWGVLAGKAWSSVEVDHAGQQFETPAKMRWKISKTAQGFRWESCPYFQMNDNGNTA